jgi:hypothetical protein
MSIPARLTRTSSNLILNEYDIECPSCGAKDGHAYVPRQPTSDQPPASSLLPRRVRIADGPDALPRYGFPTSSPKSAGRARRQHRQRVEVAGRVSYLTEADLHALLDANGPGPWKDRATMPTIDEAGEQEATNAARFEVRCYCGRWLLVDTLMTQAIM